MNDEQKNEKQQYVEDQTREFHDAGGNIWSARIVQGGGGPANTTDGPPIARILFQRVGSVEKASATVKDPGSWDLASYSEEHLRALLDAAKPRSTAS
ncbi:MAG TPA: hypothetical protein VN706_17620 [Gemmatimonadaceae bacterium]|nr:hypothetical protein [Gemmatimonadaceae bacterium]